MRIITRNEMAWDISRAQYITVYQESYDFGHTDVDECKGAKAILGLVASIAIPFAAPYIAASLGVSSVIGTTLVGAGLGGALGLATGGIKGGLLGLAGGALGGYLNAGSNPLVGTGAGAGVGVPAIGESPGAAAGLSTNVPGSGVAAFTDGGAASVSAPLAGDFSSGVSGGLGSATSSFVEGTPLLGATSNGSVAGFLNGGTGGGTAAASNGIFDNLNPDLKQAGIKLGAQAIGNALTPTPTGAGLQSQADYLNRAQAQGDKVLGLNITQNDARNKDASAVETIAANYDPQYLGNNAATASKNRDNATWAETEARLRTAGYSDQAVPVFCDDIVSKRLRSEAIA